MLLVFIFCAMFISCSFHKKPKMVGLGQRKIPSAIAPETLSSRSDTMKKFLALLLALCMMFATLAGCGPKDDISAGNNEVSTREVEPGLQIYADGEFLAEKIAVGCSGAGTTLSPHGKPDWGSVAVRDMLYSKLLRIDGDSNIYLGLLKKMPEQIDELTYKLTLWDCIYDSAGNHLTANDVEYSINLYLATGNAGGVSRYDHFEILNDYELIWHCKDPFSIGEMERQMSNFNIVTQAAWEASGTDEMTTMPVGSGAYVLESFTPGSVCVMTVNENFWMRKLPEEVRETLWIYDHQNIKALEFQVIKDASSRAIALEMGTVITADAIADIDIEKFADNPDISPVYIENDPPVPILFNCGEDSPCQDVNLRKAICYAINNADIAAGVGDYTFPIYGFQPNLADSPAEWKTGREYYDYNVDKAKEYLAKSNYKGEELTLLYVGSASAAYEDTAILLDSQLGEVGINVTLMRVDQAVNEVLRFQGTQWDMRMDTIGGGLYMTQTYKNFHSSTYQSSLNGKTLFMVEDEKLDALYDAWDADPTNAELMKAYDDYFTYEQCYGYGIIGYNLLTAARAGANIQLGERDTYIVANATTFN